ncbi:hypothetical protein BZA77DRAFT_345766 [Pyronema omphalodes]|nr:hypothetical protein BZA77DRAFT_346114 [Pyronema omphalodes]KAI5814355.1 hypothetical protein BZA77DRAFT_345766 [Pyronema omphalodes]
MHYTTIVFALVGAATVVKANECIAQNILDACKAIHEPRLLACKGNDWECYCNEATNLATCFNNCPNLDASPVKNQVIQYCMAYSAAKPQPTATAAESGSMSGSMPANATGSAIKGSSMLSKTSVAASETASEGPLATYTAKSSDGNAMTASVTAAEGAQSTSPSNGAGAVAPGMAGMLMGAVALVAGAFL